MRFSYFPQWQQTLCHRQLPKITETGVDLIDRLDEAAQCMRERPTTVGGYHEGTERGNWSQRPMSG